jgi:hypothetical protein
VSEPTERELYEAWKPFIVASRPLPPDTEQILEQEVYVEQTNGKIGSSAGGPKDEGMGEPLIRKPPIPAWQFFGGRSSR